MNIFGDAQVEAGIVDEDEHVGVELHDVSLAERHVPEYRLQV